mgnify:CR=1 FL=1
MKLIVDIKNQNIKIPDELVQAAYGDEFIARIFFNRGYKNPETVRQMLDDEHYTPTCIDEFEGIDEAVRIINLAINEGKKICIYGDYDVDGVTSTTILVECIRFLKGEVMYHVPDRFTEGYGMNEEVIKNLQDEGVSLIITCDCGIANVNEILLAKELGMGVVITDHHNIPPKLPPADVILNPKLLPQGHRAGNISGCAMAYFLCIALLENCNCENEAERYMDLLALSLVADVVSLNGENRYLLKKGIQALFNTKRTGLRALFSILEKNNKMQTEEDIGFQIAPRINAAGRMESANLPVELLLTEDESYANVLAEKIDFLNSERKNVQEKIIEEAKEQVENKKKNKAVLVLYSDFWHHGVVGIAAGKICDTYKKPAILLTLKDDGKTVVGSARSVEGVDIYELIKGCANKLIKFGGHPKAAGLSLKKEDLEEFTLKIEKFARAGFSTDKSLRVSADCNLDIKLINEEFYDKLQKIGPFGEGFEAPLFVSKNVCVVKEKKTVKNHHIMRLADENGVSVPAVMWNGSEEDYIGRKFDAVYTITKNTFRGMDEIRMTVNYLVKESEKPWRFFKGGFIDCRGKEIQDIMKDYPNAECFYEGFDIKCPVGKTIDRIKVKEARRGNDVVFITPPVNTNVFREVITAINPRKVILNFSVLPDYTFKGFLLNLLGIIKHVTKNMGGGIHVELACIKLCIEENVLFSALKYLKSMGKIDYTVEDNIISFTNCNESPSKMAGIFERSLKDALAEKNSYMNFILNLEIEGFKEYFK